MTKQEKRLFWNNSKESQTIWKRRCDVDDDDDEEANKSQTKKMEKKNIKYPHALLTFVLIL